MRSFLHTIFGQQHESAFGLSMFDYFQLDAMLGGRFFRGFARIALIHISQLDALPGDLLYLPASSPTCARSCSSAG